MKRLSILAALLFVILPTVICVAQTDASQNSFDGFAGIYRLNSNDFVSIAKFDLGDGQNRLLFTDFKSGLIRILSPVSGNNFSAGTGLLVNPPVEMRVTFAGNKQNQAASLAWQQNGKARQTARKIRLKREEVSFRSSDDVTLSGTLVSPETKGAKPTVVFLHGSGSLNRYSFGPFPDFLLSQGFAVLIYDKRGTGGSNGDFSKAAFEDLAADGRAAVSFLKGRKDVDGKRIGLCGSSQGGFLASMIASSNSDVAFVVNLYGMHVPVWQQELYRIETELRDNGSTKNDTADAFAFVNLGFEVGRTGQNWDKYRALMEQSKDKSWFNSVLTASSLDKLQRDWQKLYSFNPAGALEKVSCPVLALFGDLDNSTPVKPTIASIERALKIAGNKDLTVKIFPKGNHGLLESETGANSEIPKLKRLVPGLFETIRDWLQRRKA